MKKFKFILAFVLLGVAVIGTAKLTTTVSKSMMPDSTIKIGGEPTTSVAMFTQ